MFEALPNGDIASLKTFSLSLLITPEGQIIPQSTYEKHSIKPFKNYAATFPQKCISLDIEKLSHKFGSALFLQSIYGFVSIDFITFPDPKNASSSLFLAIGLDCYLNRYA